MDPLHLKSVVSGLQEHFPPLTCGLAQRQIGLAQLLGSIQPKGTRPSSCPSAGQYPALRAHGLAHVPFIRKALLSFHIRQVLEFVFPRSCP